MASYKQRLTRDLDGWIAAGLMPASSRDPILSSVEEGRRLDAAAALAFAAAFLLGAAVIAFVAANWDGMARVVRFGLLLAAFGAAAGGAAWSARRGRPQASNGLLALAALIYAGSIGLVGQIFNLAGEPSHALHAAGWAAATLAIVGRSSAAGVIALALTGAGDLATEAGEDAPWQLLLIAAAAAVLAWRWRSSPLAHAAGLAIVVAVVHLWARLESEPAGYALALGLAALAALARRDARAANGGERPGSDLYGWLAWGALGLFIAVGLFDQQANLLHRLLWLALGLAGLALGRHDRHALISVGGVLAAIGAGAALMFDLGFGLMASAAVFAAAAMLALLGGLALRAGGESRNAG